MTAAPSVGGQEQEAAPGSHGRSLPLRAAVVLAAVAFGMGALVSAGLLLIVGAPADSSATLIPAADGVEPTSTACMEDARPAASEVRADNVTLEVIWSDSCQAGWGRITRNDGQSAGNSVYVDIAPRGPDEDSRRQVATLADVQSAYTTMVVKQPGTLVCARGSITVGAETIDLGAPLCT